MKCNTAVTANTIVAAAIFAAMSAPANAESYAGIRYANLTYTAIDFANTDWTTPALMANIGNQLNDKWAVEARFGIGIGDDTISPTIDNQTITVSAEIDNYVGVFLRLGASADKLYPYLMLGYGQSKITRNIIGVSVGFDDSDTAYGGGVNIAFTDSVNGNIEYMSYNDSTTAEVSGISFGLEYDF